MSNLKSWRSKWQHSSVFHTVIYSILITPTQPKVHLSQWDSFCPQLELCLVQLSLILGWIPLQWLMAAATSSARSEEVKGQIDEVTWKQKERTRRHAGPLLTCEALRDNQLLSEPTRAQPGLCVCMCVCIKPAFTSHVCGCQDNTSLEGREKHVWSGSNREAETDWLTSFLSSIFVQIHIFMSY